MSETITVNVPHKLGKEAARARIESGFVKVQQEIAGKAVDVQQDWTNDDMTFAAGVMGQNITGSLHVADNHVRIEVDLPWLVAKLAGPLREKLARGTQLLLDKK